MTTHNELKEAAANVTATMNRMIDDMNRKPITAEQLRFAVCEFRSMACYLEELIRYAGAAESEGGTND